MNRRFNVRATALACALSMPVSAEDFSSADVLAAAVSSPECLDWRVSGICFWLVCTPFSCWIETTARFAHNLPDLVVSSYGRLGDNPFAEAASLYGSTSTGAVNSIMSGLPVPATGGTRSENTHAGRANTRFKEVDVIGSPAELLAGTLSSTGFLCDSEATAFYPYFLSGVDAYSWRTGLPEQFLPQTSAYVSFAGVNFSGRHLGGATNTWGRIYPRTGWSTQTDDAKMAALAAQRAIDVTLQTGQPHVYTPFGYDGFSMRWRTFGDSSATTAAECAGSGGQWDTAMGSDGGGGDYCATTTVQFPQWMPPSDENRPAWQLISPAVRSCEAFGSADPLWSMGRTDPEGEYGYLYWRCYECCYPNRGAYIQKIQWDGCND